MTPIYIGPSWAARSFDTYDDTDTEITNIAKELKLEVIDLATPAHTNYKLLKKLQSHLINNPNHKIDPSFGFIVILYLMHGGTKIAQWKISSRPKNGETSENQLM